MQQIKIITVNSCSNDLQKLNMLAKPIGIKFGYQQVGRSVNYLDVTSYLDDQNQIQYKLFTKETDGRFYLKTNSFHPPHVFKSVDYSQMIIRRNSKDATCVQDLEKLKSDLARNGHSMEMMEELEPKATQRAIEMDIFGGHVKDRKSEAFNKLIFSVKYFKELEKLREFVNSMEPYIKSALDTVCREALMLKLSRIGVRGNSSAACLTCTDTTA